MAFGHYNKMFVSVTMSIQNEQLINIPFLAPQNHLYRIEKCWIFAAAAAESSFVKMVYMSRTYDIAVVKLICKKIY